LRKAATGDTPGAIRARKLLELPEYPEELEYLVEWVYQLHGRSGVGMSTVAPLSYATVETWIRVMDIQFIEPYHIEALMVLDAALLTGDVEEEHEEPVAENREFTAWPKKKKA